MNITIRRAEPSDAEAIKEILSGPKAIAGTLQLPFPSVESWRKRIDETPEGVYHLVASVDSEVVGHLGLGTRPDKARLRHLGHIGMAVRDDWQGKGIGSALMEAAIDMAENWLNLTRLELDVFVDNEPALRLYKKFGFVIEGTRVAFAFRDGQYVDTHLMARLRQPGD